MAEDNVLENIKKLSPRDRIDKLKELEKKDKEEIEKAQALLKESEQEVIAEEETKRQIPIPQLRAVDIDSLFTPEEKELFKAKREVSDKVNVEEVKKPSKKLEDVAFEESKKRVLSVDEERSHADYLSSLAQKPAEDLFNRMRSIYSEVKETGYMSASQQEDLNNLHYATVRKMKDIESGQYTDVSKEAAQEMVITEKIGSMLQDMYGRRKTW